MTYSVGDIEQAVCHKFQLTVNDMRGPSRKRVYARPRQICMYLSRELTKASFPQIGRHLGGRDHTTILSGKRRIAKLLRETNTMAGDVEGVRELLHHMPSRRSVLAAAVRQAVAAGDIKPRSTA